MQKRKINILSRLLTVWRKELRFLQRRDWPAILLNTVRHRFSIYCQRYVILARRLDEPLPNSQPQLEVTIRQATLDDIEKLRPIIVSWQLRQFVQRMRRGHICFITLLPDGRIANYRWLSPELSSLESYHIPLEPGDIYLSFAYSLPAYRRMGLSGANFATCCRFLREQGYRRLLTRVEVGNIAALALCRKLGYQEVGQAKLFKFLGRAVRRYTPRRYQR
jgi:ribosomal protein S18 acetylase RimI-like enzyme